MGAFSLDKYQAMKPLFTQALQADHTIDILNEAEQQYNKFSALKKPAAIPGVDTQVRDAIYDQYAKSVDAIAETTMNPIDKGNAANRYATKMVNDTNIETQGISVAQKEQHDKNIDENKKLASDRKQFSKDHSLYLHNATGGTKVSDVGTKTYDSTAYVAPDNVAHSDVIKQALTPGQGFMTNKGSYTYDAVNGGFAVTHVSGQKEFFKSGEAVANGIWNDDSSGIAKSVKHDAQMQLASQLVAQKKFKNIHEAFEATNSLDYNNALSNIVGNMKTNYINDFKAQTEYEKGHKDINTTFQQDRRQSAGSGAGGKTEVPIITPSATYNGSKVKYLVPEVVEALKNAKDSGEYYQNLSSQYALIKNNYDKEAAAFKKDKNDPIDARVRYEFEYKGNFLKTILDATKNGVDPVLKKYGLPDEDIRRMTPAEKNNFLTGVLNQDFVQGRDIPLTSAIVDTSKSGEVFHAAFTQQGKIGFLDSDGNYSNVESKELAKHAHRSSLLGINTDSAVNSGLLESLSTSSYVLDKEGKQPSNDQEAFANFERNIRAGNVPVKLVKNPDAAAVARGESPIKYGITTADGSTILADMDTKTLNHAKAFSALSTLANQPLLSKDIVVELPLLQYAVVDTVVSQKYRGIRKKDSNGNSIMMIQLKDSNNWIDQPDKQVEDLISDRFAAIPDIANNIYRRGKKITTRKVDGSDYLEQ